MSDQAGKNTLKGNQASPENRSAHPSVDATPIASVRGALDLVCRCLPSHVQDHLILKMAPPVLDRLMGIITGLMAMIMVDRYYGAGGLGFYAWFFSLYSIAGYLSRYGIPNAVENQIARLPQATDNIEARALLALLTLGVAAWALCTLAFFWEGGPGWRSAHRLAFLLLGPAILIQNLTALRTALLNGAGHHGTAVGLTLRRRMVFLAAIFICCLGRLPLPLLIGSLTVSHLLVLGVGTKVIKFPSFADIKGARHGFSAMLDLGRRYLFTDNLLDVIFYLDLLILGWFVGAMDLGIYARALILTRLCLVIPSGIRPIVRRMANQWKAEGHLIRIRRFMASTMRLLFFVNGLFAIFMLDHFPRMMMSVFGLHQFSDQALTVLGLILPGLVFFSTAVALEPVFEAWGQTDRLKRTVLVVAVINLVLNLNLIPFAGIEGAALATSAAMFIHFVLLNRSMPADLCGVCIGWPSAAAALYLTYALTTNLDLGLTVSLVQTPVVLGTLLGLVGFFRIPSTTPTPSMANHSHWLEKRPV